MYNSTQDTQWSQKTKHRDISTISIEDFMTDVTSKLQPPKLECNKPVSHLDDMYQGIQIVGGHDKTISLCVVAPSA